MKTKDKKNKVVENKIKEEPMNVSPVGEALDAEIMFDNIRKGKVKDLWETLKSVGIVTIEAVSNFFLSMGQAIKEFLFGSDVDVTTGDQSGKNIVPEPIKKILTSLYELVINAVKTALDFVSRLYKSGKEVASKTIILPGNNEVKIYTVVALAAIGSLVTLGIYKVIDSIKSRKPETNPAEMEESIKITCEAFEKTKYLFKGIENLKEENDNFVHDKISTLVEKAAYVANDVINFSDPNIEIEEDEDSKLVSFFKKFKTFTIITAVAVSLVVIGKKVFGTRINTDFALPTQNISLA